MTQTSTTSVLRGAHRAPTSYWRRLAADTWLVSRATVVAHALGAVTSIALRMVLDPAAMGVWQGLKLALSYGNYSNLGVSKAAIRDYTVALGRHSEDVVDGDGGHAAYAGLDVAFTASMAASAVYASVMALAAAAVALSADDGWSRIWACGLVLVGLLAIVQRYVTFQITILRARQRFDHTAAVSVVEAVATLAAAVSLAWTFGVLGLCAATLLVSLASVVYLRRAGAWTALAWTWDAPRLRRLVRTGAPMLAAGVVFSLFRSVDRIAILAGIDDREQALGLYSIALMASAQLFGVANVLAIVVGPRLARLFGQTGRRDQVAELAARTTELLAAMLVLPAAVGLVLAPAVIGALLPKYTAGLPALVWLVPSTVLLGMTLPAGQSLVSVYRERTQLVLVGVATLVAALGAWTAIKLDAGIVGVAAAMALANVVHFATTVALAIRAPLAGARWRSCLVRWIAVGVPTMLPAIVFTQSSSGALHVVALQLLVVVLVWLATLAAAWRWGGWSQLLTGHAPVAGEFA
ncbi:MAG: oligosaccharide flippase family protein [Pirellulales bacterium]